MARYIVYDTMKHATEKKPECTFAFCHGEILLRLLQVCALGTFRFFSILKGPDKKRTDALISASNVCRMFQ